MHSIPVILEQAAVITIPALTTSLKAAVLQPSDLVAPIGLMERTPGSGDDNYEGMTRVTFIPPASMGLELRVWAWLQEDIKFVGAMANREVLLRYKSNLDTLTLNTDSLGVLFAEN